MTRSHIAPTIFSLAATVMTPAAALAADAYWYLGASAGQSSINASTNVIDHAFLVDDGFVASGTTLDKTDTGWKAYLGYRFNRFLALEGGYTDLGEATFKTTIVSAPASPDLPATPFPIRAAATANGTTLAGVLHVPIGQRFSVLAKVGGLRWQAEFTEHITSTGITRVHRTEVSTNVICGYGAELGLTDALRLRAEFERYHDIGEGIGGRKGRDVDYVSAGLMLAF